MSVPAEIPGLGSTAQKVRANPGFDAMKAGIGPEEYFVLSRIDGSLTLREVLLMTGLPIERAIDIVVKLRALGAVLIAGETPMSVPRPGSGRAPTDPGRAAMGTPPPRTGTPASVRSPTAPRGIPVAASRTPTQTAAGLGGPPRPPTSPAGSRRARTTDGLGGTRAPAPEEPPEDPTLDLDRNLEGATKEELAALSEACEITDDDRRLILAMARRLGWGDAWALLGLPPGADKRRVKRTYFRLSKDFHPDRYYGKRLGSFGPRLDKIFEALSRGYSELTDGKPKDGARPGKAQGEAQSPTEYAAELFERACQTEVHGDPLEAMKQFAAAIRIDPQQRYLRRAARCALTAGQPRSAEEYANKAAHLEPNDSSIARLLAAAFKAQGKLDAAEEVLIMALAMPSENDSLVVELRRDLAEIRRALAQTGSPG